MKAIVVRYLPEVSDIGAQEHRIFARREAEGKYPVLEGSNIRTEGKYRAHYCLEKNHVISFITTQRGHIGSRITHTQNTKGSFW